MKISNQCCESLNYTYYAPSASSEANFSSPAAVDSQYVRQAVILTPFQFNPLNSLNLLNALSPLTQLPSNSSGFPHLYSPFSYSLDSLSPPLTNSLLLTPRKRKGTLSSARGLLLSYISRSPDDDQRWVDAVANITNGWVSSNSSVSVVDPHSFGQSMTDNSVTADTVVPLSQRHRGRRYRFALLPGLPLSLQLLIIAYAFLSLYMGWFLIDLSPIRSRWGILIAYIVEIVLASSAAASVVSFIYPSFDLSTVCQFISVPLVVILTGAQNALRLINGVANTPAESSPLVRVSETYSRTAPVAARISIETILVFLFLGYFCLKDFAARTVCLFACLALGFDLLMHHTYFSAVLSVDLRRVELEELISSPHLAGIDLTADANGAGSSGNSNRRANKKEGVSLRTFLYLNYMRPHQKSAILALLIVFYMWLKRPLSVGPTGELFFAAPFWESSDWDLTAMPSSSSCLRIFEPISLWFDPSTEIFRPGPFYNSPASIFEGYAAFRLLEISCTLILILSLAAVLLKSVLPQPGDLDEYSTSDPYSLNNKSLLSKDLIGVHTLDVFQLASNGSWIATLGFDHLVCIWNAQTTGGTSTATSSSFAHLFTASGSNLPCIKSLRVPAFLWPVSKMVLSCHTQRIALISCKHSSISIWDIEAAKATLVVKNDSLFSSSSFVEAFFSHDYTIVAIGRRSFYQFYPPSQSKGQIAKNWPLPLLVDEYIITAKRLVTANIMEKIVLLTSCDRILVASFSIGLSAWNILPLNISESLSAASSIPSRQREYFQMNRERMIQCAKTTFSTPPQSNAGSRSSISSPFPEIPSTRPYTLPEPAHSIQVIPALHMVLVAGDVTASLLDVNAGVILRHFHVGQYKQGSLRVFHAQPTHCRFCGCASVQSISVAYTNREQPDMVICHTLLIEHRARNNICLRVERDPRETRCLGFEATTEHQHWITNVEAWETTDMNMLMGIRRKEPSLRGLPILSQKLDDAMGCAATSSAYSKSNESSVFSRHEAKTANKNTNTSPSPSRIRTPSPTQDSIPPLSEVWEGWIMSNTGAVTYYDIPDTTLQSRLLIPRVGPVTKFGHKSLCVVFGNIVKLLYFGKEEFQNDISTSPKANRRRVGY